MQISSRCFLQPKQNKVVRDVTLHAGPGIERGVPTPPSAKAAGGQSCAGRCRAGKAVGTCVCRLQKPGCPPSQAAHWMYKHSRKHPGWDMPVPRWRSWWGWRRLCRWVLGLQRCPGPLGWPAGRLQGQSLPLRANVGSEAKLSRADARGPGPGGRGTWPRQRGGWPRGSLPHDVDRWRHCPEGKGCSTAGNPGPTETHFSTRLDLEIGQGPHSRHVWAGHDFQRKRATLASVLRTALRTWASWL